MTPPMMAVMAAVTLTGSSNFAAMAGGNAAGLTERSTLAVAVRAAMS